MYRYECRVDIVCIWTETSRQLHFMFASFHSMPIHIARGEAIYIYIYIILVKSIDV